MPRPQALHILETLTAVANADGYLRLAEQRMLERVHAVLELPAPAATGANSSTIVRYVQPDAA
jgi:tellurite resistance protein